METTKTLAKKLGLVRKFKHSGLYKGKYTSSLVLTIPVLLVIAPSVHTILPHSPQFENPRDFQNIIIYDIIPCKLVFLKKS